MLRWMRKGGTDEMNNRRDNPRCTPDDMAAVERLIRDATPSPTPTAQEQRPSRLWPQDEDVEQASSTVNFRFYMEQTPTPTPIRSGSTGSAILLFVLLCWVTVQIWSSVGH